MFPTRVLQAVPPFGIQPRWFVINGAPPITFTQCPMPTLKESELLFPSMDLELTETVTKPEPEVDFNITMTEPCDRGQETAADDAGQKVCAVGQQASAVSQQASVTIAGPVDRGQETADAEGVEQACAGPSDNGQETAADHGGHQACTVSQQAGAMSQQACGTMARPGDRGQETAADDGGQQACTRSQQACGTGGYGLTNNYKKKIFNGEPLGCRGPSLRRKLMDPFVNTELTRSAALAVIKRGGFGYEYC